MIEKMKFVTISGPKDDLDRMVNDCLSHYEIQLENAMTQLRSAAHLVPITGTNPYRESWTKAQKLISVFGKDTDSPAKDRPTADEAAALVDQMDQALEQFTKQDEQLAAEQKETEALLDQVRLFEELDFNISVLLKFQHVKYRFGRIKKDLYQKLEDYAAGSEDVILYKCHDTGFSVSLLYFVPEPMTERIDAVFSSMQFERIYLPDSYNGTPEEEISRLTKEIEDLKLKRNRVKADRDESFLKNRAGLLAAAKVLEAYYSNFNVRKYAACVHDSHAHPYYLLCGWLTEEEAAALKKELEADINTFFSFEDGSTHQNGTPPTKLKNKGLLKPFEMFVRMYGLPAYDEFDPTLLIAITYSVFFGFMFGDAGQGLLLLFGGFLIWKKKKSSLAAIVSCCGFFSTVFGLLFGSVFGFEDVIPALWLRPSEAMTTLPFVGRLNTVFVTAIALGMVMILLMMILNMIISFRNKDTEKTWFDTNGLAGFVFYLSATVTIFLFMSGKTVPAAAVLTVMFLLPLCVIFFKEPLTAAVERKSEKISGSKGMFFVQGFFELFEVLLSYFSNTLSFVRIGAFAVSHAAMMQVVLMLAGAESGDLNLVVVVLGNLFVCGMEGLIVGIQVLRLEYYELFSRFYRGTGREFKPFS